MNDNMMQNPNPNQTKYKTILCKHFDTPKGCVYNDKCQFAHGAFELKSTVNSMFNNQGNYQRPQHQNMGGFKANNKKIPNPQNFKIVKCKNFEKDGACKYGNTCTFAHGDEELRNKNENVLFGNPHFGGMNPQMMGMFNPFNMDPSMLMGMGLPGVLLLKLGLLSILVFSEKLLFLIVPFSFSSQNTNTLHFSFSQIETLKYIIRYVSNWNVP